MMDHKRNVANDAVTQTTKDKKILIQRVRNLTMLTMLTIFVTMYNKFDQKGPFKKLTQETNMVKSSIFIIVVFVAKKYIETENMGNV